MSTPTTASGTMPGMELGVHLPLMSFRGEPLSAARIFETVDAAVELGFAAVTANDHFLFQTPWLDGPTALASVIDRSRPLDLATTISLASLRGPVALAKQLAAIDILSGGRLTAGLGPGSSPRDYAAVGLDFERRWPMFDESVIVTRALLRGEPVPDDVRYHPIPSDIRLLPLPARPVPLWIGSWGSDAGLRRVARLADGWLASAYNTTPPAFSTARARLSDLCRRSERPDLPNALATMWTWVGDEAEADRVLTEVLAPMLGRDPDPLRDQVCVGTPARCATLLRAYADAGCHRVYLWLLGDESVQLARVAHEVMPLV